MMHQVEKKVDWDPIDVKYALAKRGLSLAELARRNGMKPTTLPSVFRVRSYPKCERIIADALGLEPREIWPSRYLAKKSAA